MTRAELKKLSSLRLKEARILKDKRCFSGAYYLCGYSIECALKACIAKKTKRSEFPPDIKAIQAIYTHDLTALIKAVGLEIELKSKINSDVVFERYWGVVKDWSEKSRYQTFKKRDADDILKAVSDPINGVLVWIQIYW